jgi:hypothetical protein
VFEHGTFGYLGGVYTVGEINNFIKTEENRRVTG